MPCTDVERKLTTQYRVKETENIHYVDVINLYHYICKYGRSSCGHPKLYVGADCHPDCLDREGIIKDTNCGVLFAQYVNMFLKLKQESTGKPSWVQCQEDRDRYI